jgi:molecular chaperone Hsp33
MRDETTDYLIRAVSWDGKVRLVAAVTTGVVERLRSIHDPSPVTTAAVGRLATGALLLAATLEKVTGREPMLTIEVDGGGPAGRLLATASPAGWVRAMVANPAATAESKLNGKLNVSGVVGTDGELAVIRDPGFGEPFRGVVPLHAGEIAQDIAHYLHDSEQTPSAVVLGVHVLREARVANAGGFVVQLLPGVSDAEAATLTRRIRDFGPVTTHLAAGQQPASWLDMIFPEGVEVLDSMPVEFRCGCSYQKIETALKLLGAREIRGLIESAPANPTVLTCGFCRGEYSLSPAILASLLREVEEERSSEDPF